MYLSIYSISWSTLNSHLMFDLTVLWSNRSSSSQKNLIATYSRSRFVRLHLWMRFFTKLNISSIGLNHGVYYCWIIKQACSQQDRLSRRFLLFSRHWFSEESLSKGFLKTLWDYTIFFIEKPKPSLYIRESFWMKFQLNFYWGYTLIF